MDIRDRIRIFPITLHVRSGRFAVQRLRHSDVTLVIDVKISSGIVSEAVRVIRFFVVINGRHLR